jgi:hypothetical protein
MEPGRILIFKKKDVKLARPSYLEFSLMFCCPDDLSVKIKAVATAGVLLFVHLTYRYSICYNHDMQKRKNIDQTNTQDTRIFTTENPSNKKGKNHGHQPTKLSLYEGVFTQCRGFHRCNFPVLQLRYNGGTFFRSAQPPSDGPRSAP